MSLFLSLSHSLRFFQVSVFIEFCLLFFSFQSLSAEFDGYCEGELVKVSSAKSCPTRSVRFFFCPNP